MNHRAARAASLVWFPAVLLGIVVLTRVGGWYRRNGTHTSGQATGDVDLDECVSSRRIAVAMGVLIGAGDLEVFLSRQPDELLTFYLIHRFGVSVQASQVYLFVFLFGGGGGDDRGRAAGRSLRAEDVIWVSILGVAPFSIALPHMGLTGTVILSVIVGVVLASAFSAILSLRRNCAGEGGVGGGIVLRVRVWRERDRVGGAG